VREEKRVFKRNIAKPTPSSRDQANEGVREGVNQPGYSIKNVRAVLYKRAHNKKYLVRGIFLLAPELKPSQTFEIILPNLIHKSKKRNLK